MLKSAGFTLLAKLLVAMLNFGTIILISRFLGPEAKGICSWYLVIVAVSLVFSETISGPTVGFLLLKHPLVPIRNVSYLWALITSTIVTFSFLMSGKVNSGDWILLIVVCWLNAAISLHLHILLAKQRIAWFNLLAVLAPLLVLIFSTLFFMSGFQSVTYYLWSLSISWAIVFFIGLFAMRSFSVDDNPGHHAFTGMIKEGFRYGIVNQAGHLTSLLHNRLIFFLLPAGLLGIFSNALSLAEASLMIPGSLGQVMYATLLNSKEKTGSEAIVNRNLFLSLAIVGAGWLLVLLIPDQFYQFIFGGGFAGVKQFLVYLMGITILYAGYLVTTYWQSANGLFINNLYGTGFGLIVNLAYSLFFYFRHQYDIITGITGLGLGFLSMFLISILLLRKEQKRLKDLASVSR